MGAQKSIHAGKGEIVTILHFTRLLVNLFVKVFFLFCFCFGINGLVFDFCIILVFNNVTAKIDVNVDFTHKLCASLMLPPLRFLLLSFLLLFVFRHWMID